MRMIADSIRETGALSRYAHLRLFSPQKLQGLPSWHFCFRWRHCEARVFLQIQRTPGADLSSCCSLPVCPSRAFRSIAKGGKGFKSENGSQDTIRSNTIPIKTSAKHGRTVVDNTCCATYVHAAIPRTGKTESTTEPFADTLRHCRTYEADRSA